MYPIRARGGLHSENMADRLNEGWARACAACRGRHGRIFNAVGAWSWLGGAAGQSVRRARAAVQEAATADADDAAWKASSWACAAARRGGRGLRGRRRHWVKGRNASREQETSVLGLS